MHARAGGGGVVRASGAPRHGSLREPDGRLYNIVTPNTWGASAPPPARIPHGRSILGVVGLGTFLTALSGSSVNLALPDLGQNLHISLAYSRWVLQAFLLAVAIALPLAGRAGDAVGHSRVYLAGFAIFGLASLGCGFAQRLEWLVAGRALQGVGGAMVMATGPALLTTSFPAQQRGRVLGFVSTATYTGLTIGPTVGGLIVGAGGWRWTFFFNFPLVVIILLLGARHLPARHEHATGPRAPLWALFDWGLFRSPLFNFATLSALANYIALFVMTLLVPFYLQEGLGRDPSRTGLILSAQPLVMALVATPSGWLSDRIGSRGLASAGLALQGLGLFCLSRVAASGTDLVVAACLAVVGLGTGIFISPNSSALMGAAPRARQGAASSVMAEARIVGMLLGVTLGTTLFAAAGGRTGSAWRPAEFAAMQSAVRWALGIALGGAVVAALRGERAQPSRGSSA